MKHLLFSVFASACLLSVAADANSAKPAKHYRNPVLMKTGGMIARPGVKAGTIAILNCQTTVPEKEFTKVAVRFSRTLHVNVPVRNAKSDVTPREMASALKTDGSDFGIFIFDCNQCDTTIGIFPEQRFAYVNVAPLKKNGGEDPIFLSARSRKELARAFLYLTGGAASQNVNNLMGPMNSPKDLDKYADDAIPVDAISRANAYLPAAGCNTRTLVPYRTAVREGWAPAPTNEYQKVIWDRIHALPTKPIKILPEKTKVTE